MPTVIVDVTGDDAEYEYMIEFTCKNESPLIEVTELRFSSRYQTITPEIFASLKQTSLDAGIPQDIVDSVQLADQAQCSIGDDMDSKDKLDKAKKWASNQFDKAKHWWKNNGFL